MVSDVKRFFIGNIKVRARANLPNITAAVVSMTASSKDRDASLLRRHLDWILISTVPLKAIW